MPVTSVEELVAYARAHPGRLTYASGGNGSTSGLAAELFKSMAGVDIVQIPYKGSAPAVVDLVSGHVDIMFADLALVLPHANAGTLRLLAAAGEARAPGAPTLATVAEQGYPGFRNIGMVHSGCTGSDAGCRDREARRSTRRRRCAPTSPPTPAAAGLRADQCAGAVLASMIRADIAKFGTLVRSAGIKGGQ